MTLFNFGKKKDKANITTTKNTYRYFWIYGHLREWGIGKLGENTLCRKITIEAKKKTAAYQGR